MEKELLAIVATLGEFRTMLLGAELNIFTDHRNLTFHNFNTQCVLRWRTIVEEYSPKLFYLEGKFNVLADAFLRLPRFDPSENREGKSPGSMVATALQDVYHIMQEPDLYECLNYHPDLDDYFDSYALMLPKVVDDAPVQLMNIPSFDANPLNYEWLKDTQDTDRELRDACDKVELYSRRSFDETELICYTPPRKPADRWKICLTDEAVGPAIAWVHQHQMLGHSGS